VGKIGEKPALHPTRRDREGNSAKLLRGTEKARSEHAASFSSQRPPGGFLRRSLLTVRLQPQMKKYRCLWCVSTTNHNILYFLIIFSIRLFNTGIRLWKAQKSLARCGLLRVCLTPKIRATPCWRAGFAPLHKPSPGGGREQGLETVQNGVQLCERWGPDRSAPPERRGHVPAPPPTPFRKLSRINAMDARCAFGAVKPSRQSKTLVSDRCFTGRSSRQAGSDRDCRPGSPA